MNPYYPKGKYDRTSSEAFREIQTLVPLDYDRYFLAYLLVMK